MTAQQALERVCTEPGCITVLSAYNRGLKCFRHQERLFLRPKRGGGAADWPAGDEGQAADNPDVKRVTRADVVDAVCRHYRIELEELFRGVSQLAVQPARRIAIFLLHTVVSEPSKDIAYLFNLRDVKSVREHLNRVTSEMSADPKFACTVGQISALVRLLAAI